MISNYTNEVSDIARGLQADFELTDAEALRVAVEIHRNGILRGIFVLDYEGYPNVLEKIAMILDERLRFGDLR